MSRRQRVIVNKRGFDIIWWTRELTSLRRAIVNEEITRAAAARKLKGLFQETKAAR